MFLYQADIQKFLQIGDESRTAMLLQVSHKQKHPFCELQNSTQADASVRQSALWLNPNHLLDDKDR
jgi:hypothetical protein